MNTIRTVDNLHGTIINLNLCDVYMYKKHKSLHQA